MTNKALFVIFFKFFLNYGRLKGAIVAKVVLG